MNKKFHKQALSPAEIKTGPLPTNNASPVTTNNRIRATVQ